MNAEIFAALAQLEKERGIPQAYMMEKITQALVAAYKKDKDGGVDIADCEAISRAMDPILDEKDPIPTSYTFEVCSAGIERALKRPGDFARFLDSDVLVRLYRPRDGVKEFPGVLRGYEDGCVTIDYLGKPITFEKSEVALVRLRATF